MRTFSAVSALALVMGLSSNSSAQGRDEVLGVLEMRRDDTRDQAQVARQLAALEPEPIPVLFNVYARGVEALFSGEAIDLSKYWCAPDSFSSLALDALCKCASEEVIEYVESQAAKGLDLGQRLGLMRLIGALESRRGLEPLVRLMDGISRDELASITIQFTFEDALAAILEHDGLAPRTLNTLTKDQDMERMPMFVRAALKADHPRSLEYLSTQVGRSEKLDADLLLILAKLQERFPWQRARGLDDLISMGLRSQDPELQAKAAWAAGHTYQIEHARDLLDLLNHASPRLRNISLQALVRLSAERYQDAQALWEQWLEEEATWWKEESPGLLSKLLPLNDPEADQSAASDALRKLARHPLYAQRIAADVARMLPNLDANLARQGVRLLETLGSRMALPALIEELASSDQSLQSAAHRALRKITGERFGPQRKAWADYARL